MPAEFERLHGNSGDPLWIADWSDSEDDDFREACAGAGVNVRVIRTRPLGASVGTRLHRLRSWPSYASLALRGIHYAGDATLVAWQPNAGALAALMRRRHRPPLLLLNPLLDATAMTLRQRILLAGATRAERVIFFSRPALEIGVSLGVPRSCVRFVPLGVKAASVWRPPTGDHLLAFGRSARDWTTLARAARGLQQQVHVVGPNLSVSRDGSPLNVLPQVDRQRLLALIEEARAVVIPLAATERVAGQLAVLDAMAVGRAVVATRTPGTEDYVSEQTGLLVPPADEGALREALLRVLEPAVAETMGRAAHEAASGPFSLERFVATVHGEARALG
jgi:glycosyltransferase involved in cell wall biosynthesis